MPQSHPTHKTSVLIACAKARRLPVVVAMRNPDNTATCTYCGKTIKAVW